MSESGSCGSYGRHKREIQGGIDMGRGRRQLKVAWIALAWTVGTVIRVVPLDTGNAIGVGVEVLRNETNMAPHANGDTREARSETTARSEASMRNPLADTSAAAQCKGLRDITDENH
jgi:hypothetical protein